jgi:hypothetical protein
MNILDPHAIADSKKSQHKINVAITSVRNKSKMIHSANEDILSKLNSIAIKKPFCAWHKQREHDPL